MPRMTVLLTLCLVAALGCSPKDADEHAEALPDSLIVVPMQAVRAGQIAREAAQAVALADTITLTGEIQADPLRAAHVATRVPGTVQSVHAVVGTHVGRGQVLATLYSPEFLAAETDFLLAHERVERTPEGSDNDLPALRGIVQSSRRRLEVLGAAPEDIAAIERTHRSLDVLTLRSPRSGVVTEVSAAVGKQVAAGEDLFGVSDPSVVWAVVNAHEQDLATLRPGQVAELHANAYPDRTFTGRVSTLEGSLDEATRTLKVRISVSNPGLVLKPGMFVTAQIASGRTREVVILPEAAVQDLGGAKVVFVAQNDSTFVARAVEVRALGGDRVEVVRGVTPGTMVAVKGAFLVRSQAQKSELGEDE